ncbi:hypothetical protein AGR5A_pa10010 [Agrobacterium genomosp. 5 str. CFBP 6626]|nr:hypothetical protein AGR5A_pa10010 [Agrobacterium genomosp. 5 str. CFBP 6626]
MRAGRVGTILRALSNRLVVQTVDGHSDKTSEGAPGLLCKPISAH